MQILMRSAGGPVTIESSEVTQFYPDSSSGNEYTKIETLSADGVRGEVVVKHDFFGVTKALTVAWDADAKRADIKPAKGGNHA